MKLKFSLDNCYFVECDVSSRFFCPIFLMERRFQGTVPITAASLSFYLLAVDGCYFVKYAALTGIDRWFSDNEWYLFEYLYGWEFYS